MLQGWRAGPGGPPSASGPCLPLATLCFALGYLQSCERETVDCDGGQVGLSRSETEASGVVVFRNDADAAAPLQIFSTTPVFTFVFAAVGETLELEPRDGVSPALSLPIEGPVMDFQAFGRKLKAGGIYEVLLEDRRVEIKVVFFARPGGPLIGRLVRF